MNRGVLYGLAVVVGLGAAVAVFWGSGETRGTVTGGAPASGERPAPRPTAEGEGDWPAEGAQAPPGPIRSVAGPGESDGVRRQVVGGHISPEAAESNARMTSPFGQHTSAAAPSWQALGREMEKAGQAELATRCEAMAGKLRAARREAEPDLPTFIQEQRALLEALRPVAPESASNSVARIESLLAELEASMAAPAPTE